MKSLKEQILKLDADIGLVFKLAEDGVPRQTRWEVDPLAGQKLKHFRDNWHNFKTQLLSSVE